MRDIIQDQMPIVPIPIDHEYARELEMMNLILIENPKMARLVYNDLMRGVKNPNKGRNGMTAEQVLRADILKQLRQFSYKELAFNIADSRTYKTFVGYGIADETPKISTLKKNIKRIRPLTMEMINRLLLEYALKKGIEMGKKVRVDCTVTDSNIHDPSDTWLLWDCVRVLCREMGKARDSFGTQFKDRRQSAKRRYIGIVGAKNADQRDRLYKDQLMITREVIANAEDVIVELGNSGDGGPADIVLAQSYSNELRHFIDLSAKVIDQTIRRVVHGETVPATEKIVSIFEPHTNIIIKDRRKVQFGHKIVLSNGASGLITDCIVLVGNPADSTLAVQMIERHIEIYGKPPEQAAFDGGFTSAANLSEIKKLNVGDVMFSKRRGLSIEDMAKSGWVYKSLKKFRAGIEAVISFLKRSFGLGRCLWRGFESFQSYVWSSIVSANLLMLARHTLS